MEVEPDRAQSLDDFFVLDCLVWIIGQGDRRKDERTDLGGRDTLAVESVVHFGLIAVEGMRRHPARGLEVVSILSALTREVAEGTDAHRAVYREDCRLVVVRSLISLDQNFKLFPLRQR